MVEQQKQQPKAAKISIYSKIENAYYALADFVDKKLHLPVYKLFIDPIEKHGIPSFPVFLVVLLAIIGGVALLFSGPVGSTGAFQVTVYAAGKPVDGARVAVTGQGIDLEQMTKKGIASFAGLAIGTKVKITIEKEGFQTKNLSVTVSAQGTKAVLSAAEKPLKMVEVKLQVIDGEGNLVENADVAYSAGEQSGDGVTDASGAYTFNAKEGTNVRATASKSGFDETTEYFTAAENAVKQLVLMQSKQAINTNFNDEEGNVIPIPDDGYNSDGTGGVEYSRVVVEVKSADGSDFGKAKVSIHDAKTAAVINSAYASLGKSAEFTSIVVGKKVYAVVDANGFTQNKTETKIVGADKTVLLATLSKQVTIQQQGNKTKDGKTKASGTDGTGKEHNIECDEKTGKCTDNGKDMPNTPGGFQSTDGNGTTINFNATFNVNVKDAKNKTIKGADVVILDEENSPLYSATTDKNGQANFTELSLGKTVIVFVSAGKYLPYWSDPVTVLLGTEENVTMTLADENNSATLAINAISLNNTPVFNATVALTVDGKFLPQVRITDQKGQTTFDDPVLIAGATVSVNATTWDAFEGSNETVLEKGKNSMQVILITPEVNVKFKAVDFLTKKEVNANVNISLKLYGEKDELPVYNCATTPNKPCTTKLKSKIPYTLHASSDGYSGTTDSFFQDDPNQTENTKIIYLFKKSDALAELLQVSDGSGNPATALTVGSEYYAEFRLTSKNETDKTVFFVSLGDKPAATNNLAAIIRLNSEKDTLFGPTTNFKQPVTAGTSATGCSAESQLAERFYKWTQVELPANNESDAEYVFKVPIMVLKNTTGKELNIEYRAYALLNKTSTTSTPENNVLSWPQNDSLTEKNTAKPRCDLNTINKNYTINPLTETQFQCGSGGCIWVQYQQKNAKGGNNFIMNYSWGKSDENKLKIIADTLLLNPPTDCEEQQPVYFNFQLNNYFQYDGSPTPSNLNEQLAATNQQISYSQCGENNYHHYEVNFEVTKEFTELLNVPITYDLASGKANMPSNLIVIEKGSSKPLPSGYVLRYNEEEQDLQLFESTDTNFDYPKDTIQMHVDPIMPADAVYLTLDYSSLPLSCVKQSTLTAVTPENHCFDYKNYDSADNKKILLTYDGIKSDCVLKSNDPNNLNPFEGKIELVAFCTINTRKEFKLEVIPHNEYKAAYFLTGSNVPIADVSAKTATDLTTSTEKSKIVFFVNQRQYGSIGKQKIGVNGKEVELSADLTNQPAILPMLVNEGDTNYYGLDNLATNLGPNDAITLLKSTAFRRRETYPGDAEFPYSVFAAASNKAQQPKIYWLQGTRASTERTEQFSKECDVFGDDRGLFIAKATAVAPVYTQAEYEQAYDDFDNNALQLTTEAVKLTPTNYFQAVQSACPMNTLQPICGPNYLSCGNCIISSVMLDGKTTMNADKYFQNRGSVQINVGRGIGPALSTPPTYDTWTIFPQTCAVYKAATPSSCWRDNTWPTDNDLHYFWEVDAFDPITTNKPTLIKKVIYASCGGSASDCTPSADTTREQINAKEDGTIGGQNPYEVFKILEGKSQLLFNGKSVYYDEEDDSTNDDDCSLAGVSIYPSGQTPPAPQTVLPMPAGTLGGPCNNDGSCNGGPLYCDNNKCKSCGEIFNKPCAANQCTPNECETTGCKKLDQTKYPNAGSILKDGYCYGECWPGYTKTAVQKDGQTEYECHKNE